MTVTSKIKADLWRVMQATGLEVSVRSAKSDFAAIAPSAPLPIDMDELQRLSNEYRSHPLHEVQGLEVWKKRAEFDPDLKGIDTSNFRAHNAYVWQANYSAVEYALSALWAERLDSFGMLEKTFEDGAFGAQCIRMNDRLWSRDLMDSILELTFLTDHLPAGYLEEKKVIDVGAGYGRLAHRLAEITANENLYCTDGIALSTVPCRAYLRFRQLESRVSVLNLSDIIGFTDNVDLAINVHSFSEMSVEAVCWWLDWLVERQVQYLFIVPNKPGPSLNDHTSLMPHLAARGFTLEAQRSKYEDPLVGKFALHQAAYYLFGRTQR